MTYVLVMLIALTLDVVFGWPDRIYRKIGHPVVWIGWLISGLEARLNTGPRHNRLANGTLTTVAVILIVLSLAFVCQWMLPSSMIGTIVAGVLAWPFSAARSLQTHVQAVIDPLMRDDIVAARNAVSMIVGRDPNVLDTPAIARATAETLAENTSDGVIAPIFWGMLFGLPGIAVYKTINTLDSMIGHRSDRYEAFGKVAARLDDIVNWVPARITGAAYCLSRPSHMAMSWRIMLKDAGKHRSPNAGWPEAALAGAIGRRLSGPRVYGSAISDEPWVHGSAADPDGSDLLLSLQLFRRVVAMAAGTLLVLAVFG